MSKRTTIITLGILVAIMPFLGFPGAVKTIFFIIAGLVLAVIGYVLGSECEKCDVKTDLPVEGVKAETPTFVDSPVMNDKN